MSYIKEHYKTHWFDSYHEKRFGNLEVRVWYNAFKIYYHSTCIVSYSDISKDVIFDNGWWKTVSTAQNLKDFVEEIFDFKWLPRWGWIDPQRKNWEWVYEWEAWQIIYIPDIKYLYL
jgi:hypothetical protein